MNKAEAERLIATSEWNALKAFILSKVNGLDPALPIEDVAKLALVHTGMVDVFRTAEALAVEVVKKDQVQQPVPYECYGEED
jgi:nicotinamide riboside kinase